MIDRSKPEKELAICISNELNELKGKVDSLETLSDDFRKNVTTDFVDTITRRFENVERTVEELTYEIEKCKAIADLITATNERFNEKFEKMEKAIEELSLKVENFKAENLKTQKLIGDVRTELINKINRTERKRVQEKEMEAALKKLAGPDKVKVNKKLLEELAR